MTALLKLGSTGSLVTQWQVFLLLQGQAPLEPTGFFDAETVAATKLFQEQNSLTAHGMAGRKTFKTAATLGFDWTDDFEPLAEFPAKPDFPPIDDIAKQLIFGPLKVKPDPAGGFPEAVEIVNSMEWDPKIVALIIPQLIGVKGANEIGKLRFHTKAAAQMTALWQAWEEMEVLSQVVSYDGSYFPRYVRGLAAQQVLSSHAFGTAFDINSEVNGLNEEPAKPGQKGCLYDLVPLAHEFGFYWGGHFKRKDGMHFEIAKIVDLETSAAPDGFGFDETETDAWTDAHFDAASARLEGLNLVIAALEAKADTLSSALVAKLAVFREAATVLEARVTGVRDLHPINDPSIPEHEVPMPFGIDAASGEDPEARIGE